MSDKILTPNIHLPESHMTALVNHATDNNISAEQAAAQIVMQWISTVLEPDRDRNNFRKIN